MRHETGEILRFAQNDTRGVRRAFTLIEVITTICVGSILCGIASTIMLSASKLRTEAAARAEITDTAALACEQIIRYIREIPQDAALTGLAQISTATATEIRFGNTGFRLSGTQIQITLNNGTNWYPVAKDVTSLAFSYFNKTGGSLTSFPLSQTDREAVRRVRVRVTLSRSNETDSIQSSVYLRSFMNEVLNDP